MKNRIEIIGYLAAKPAQRFLPTGTVVANARIGETYVISHGSGKDQTEHKQTNWHSVCFWGENAKAAARLEKGARIAVIGTLEFREWTGNDGSKRSTWEVQVSHFHQLVREPKPDTAPIESTGVADDANWPA